MLEMDASTDKMIATYEKKLKQKCNKRCKEKESKIIGLSKQVEDYSTIIQRSTSALNKSCDKNLELVNEINELNIIIYELEEKNV